MGKTETAKLITQLALQGGTAMERTLLGLNKTVGTVKHSFEKFQSTLYFAKQNFDWIANIEKQMKGMFQEPIVAADNWRESLQMVGFSAAEAKQKITDLLQESIKLDQPHKSTVEAFITAKKMGGGELTSPENMALVSRAAKYTTSDFAQMEQTIGSVYQKLKEGKDFAMAAKPLREMGLISGETMKQIEELAEGDEKKLEALKEKIESLTKIYENLFPSQRIEQGREITALTAQYEDLKANPQTVNVFDKVWPRIKAEIAATTSKVDLADQTYADVMQHNADIRDHTLRAAGGPAFDKDFQRKQRESKLVANSIEFGTMDEQIARLQAQTWFKGVMAGLFSKGAEYFENPTDRVMRNMLPEQAVRYIQFGDTSGSPTERMLGKELGNMPRNHYGAGSDLSMFPSYDLLPNLQAGLSEMNRPGPTSEGMWGMRFGEINQDVGEMVVLMHQLKTALGQTLQTVLMNQGKF